MKLADLALAVSLGFTIGLAYADMLSNALVGDYTMIILSLLYLTCCVLYPMYGYVPEVDREGALMFLLISLLAVYVIPVLSILSLGLLICLRSIESVFHPTIKYYKGVFGLPIMSGFILGSQYGNVDMVKFSMLFIPSMVCLACFIWNGLSAGSEYETIEELGSYSRKQLLGVHLAKTAHQPDVRSRGG